ncbi:exodeoxyribonuclease V subunit alpha [Nocardia cyriacigeorgica]|uniref:RecBCD enzyme subunit RecD n=2 Tax=Nocardia cyriacigeorgica TaxID=135487 RepID=A0A6P1D7D8_9NOCA|nr:exodeoxyribonuclease V subunit alpha [Nocardia cyriacigeorgica]NEW39930.1 exodeoxyribonuclease V subunit alpha [Nocardia cyriacigeorgica]NEW45254.1 exodeoxyribonuclease V subunit alpha [Nocardia cyriacigeorgica]NEW51413.1 exodeoxyribonuclease V subunit alpha [Nocardia cyriacigeorgica]NEW55351.1 exodeoxyribonuclease V subunit alpha [Nocardia cyriacigeorgica]
MTSIQIAQRGTGLLRAFNEAGVLSAADVHVAVRLGRLGREESELALFAAALAVRAVRSGSVCLELARMREIGIDADETWDTSIDPAQLPWPEFEGVLAALRASPLVLGGAAGPLRPLRLVEERRQGGPLLYLDRYFQQEQVIRRVLTERADRHPVVDPDVVRRELDRLFAESGVESVQGVPDRQRLAAALAATHWTTVVAGGPGTGKTHTIARIIALLDAHQRANPKAPALRIALAAPTGKAAARLQEAVRDQAGELGLPELSASTLHRLLGWQRGRGTRFRYHEFNRLPYDVIVVDETSMVSLTMMSRLMSAMRPDTRLVLVGDPDQLASVDAGAVLADLVAGPVVGTPNPVLEQIAGSDAGGPPHPEALSTLEQARLRGGIVRLTRGRRFGGRIADLAVAVRAGDADTALDLLRAGGDALSLSAPDDTAAVRADVVEAARRVTDAALAGDAATALTALESHRLLCAHRQGPFGVERWDRMAADWAAAAGAGPESGQATWYPGQPLLVTANDHEARIYNGDTGVMVRQPDGSLRAALQRGSEPYLVHPTQFPSVVTVFAMTIHRSQGSQYDAVTIVLPEPESTLLTRELLYTAITRARGHVRIIGTDAAIRAATARRVLRASGLSHRAD